jgi:hypothetical protein
MYHKSNTSLFLNSFWENSTHLSLYTDASGTLGFGGFSAPSGFRVNGLPHQTLSTKNISIDWQELYAILVASYIWAPLWAQKRIVFHCNNRFQQTSFQQLAPHADRPSTSTTGTFSSVDTDLRSYQLALLAQGTIKIYSSGEKQFIASFI